MANGPNDFLTKIPEVPLITKSFEAIGQGLDHFMNDIVIKGIGGKLDALTAEVRGMGKAGISLGDSKLAGGLDSAPALTPSSSPSPAPSPGQSQDMAKSIGPEKVRNMAIEAAGSKPMGLEVAHASEQDLGNFSPSAASAGITQSQGRAV